MKNTNPFQLIYELKPATLRELQNLALKINEDIWLENKSRKKEFPYHSDVDTIVLKYCSNQTFIDALWRKQHSEIIDQILPVINKCSSPFKFSSNFYSRVMIARLSPQGHIKKHYDYENVHHFTHRIHIPVITSEKVEFYVRDQMRVLPAGKVFEISNKDYHWVKK